MDGDFAAFAKQSIHNSGFNSSHLPSKFSVKEYCPLVFRDLRDRFGVDADMFLSSHCDEPAVFIDTPKKSQGALYRTHDSEYMIQTLSKEDVQNFHNVFASYHSYIVERHSQAADTLLPHYLGMFRVTVSGKDTHYLLMRNVQSYLPDMHTTYDLKGSDVGRDASEAEMEKLARCLFFRHNRS
jgi:1-phosphatidylinositol-5-phosphate 4-kinase